MGSKLKVPPAQESRKSSFIVTDSHKLHQDYGYGHLSAVHQTLVDAILKGKKPLERLPEPESRVIRLFISSTFTDTIEERNFLLTIFSKVAAHCRQRHGIEFHALDMRWGIPLEAKFDHSIAQLCLDEIRSSHKQSLGPHFLIVLGHKYGYVDVPCHVEPKAFEALRLELVKKYNLDKVELLNVWYKLDTNARAPDGVYTLQPIQTVLGDEELNLGNTDSRWPGTESELFALLKEGASLAVEQGTLAEEFLKELNSSITEKEIRAGAIDLPSHIKRDLSVACVVRTITDITDCLGHPLASKFIDMKPAKHRQSAITNERLRIDVEKQEGLKKLREEIVVPNLDPKNVLEYSVFWKDLASVKLCLNPKKIEWKEQTFYNVALRLQHRLEDLIEANVEKQKHVDADFLYRDVIEHWYLARQKVQEYHGRALVLETISDYIMSENTETPIIVHGQLGSGKSAVIAKAATSVRGHYLIKSTGSKLPPIPPIILRFCGLTSQSSTTRQLLQSLCHQIAYVTDRSRQQVPTDYKRAISYFRTFLQHCDSSQRVVILLSGVDMLNREDNISVVDWLPHKLSPHAKLIISTGNSSESDKTLSKLLKKYDKDTNVIELQELEVKKCEGILQEALKNREHQLTDQQWEVVRAVFDKCSLPVFVRFTLEEVIHWKSYNTYDMNSLAHSVEECATRFFNKMAKKHGHAIVKKFVGYITVSNGGMSEAELGHICSLDDELLDEVFMLWKPPVRRIPSMLLLRIKHDFAMFLSEKNVDETDVMFWHYETFAKKAEELYVADPHERHRLHWHISDFYLGVWSHKPKPYKSKGNESSALRHVPKQPIEFKHQAKKSSPKSQNHCRFNLRKLNQLPFHLAASGRQLTLNSQVFFNFKWIRTKLEACSIQKIIADYDMVDREEINIVANALRMCESALAANPETLGLELTGRLLTYYQTYSDICHLLTQCDKAAEQKCAVIPNWQTYQSPSGPLQYVSEVDTNISKPEDVKVIETEDSVFVLAKPVNRPVMRIWDATLGESLDKIQLPVESTIHPSPCGSLLHVVERKKFLVTYAFGETFHCGMKPLRRIDFGNTNIHNVVVSQRYVVITKSHGKGPIVIDAMEGRIIFQSKYEGATIAAISKDEQYLLINNESTLLYHSVPDLTIRVVIPVEVKPTKMLFTTSNIRFYALDEHSQLKEYKVSKKTGTASTVGIVQDKNLRNFVFSHKEELLLAQSDMCLYLFDMSSNRLLHRIDKMPPGHFKEKMTKFKAALFSASDKIVIAARHTYIATWLAKSAEPLHVFQTSVSAIMDFYACASAELAISVHEDFSLHVWNVDEINSNAQQCTAILRSGIKCMSASENCDKIICSGTRFPEAIVLDVSRMKQLCTVQHSDVTDKPLLDVIMSPTGNCVITRMENDETDPEVKPWPLLRSDKLWDASSGQCRVELTCNRYVTFSPDGNYLVCVRCKLYTVYNWSKIKYDVYVFEISKHHSVGIRCAMQHGTYPKKVIDLPFGDVIGLPVITECKRFYCFLLQMPSARIETNPDTKESIEVETHSIKLKMYEFAEEAKGIQDLDIEIESKEDEVLIDVEALSTSRLLLMTGTTEDGYISHNADGTLYLGDVIPKQCLVFSLNSRTVQIQYNANIEQLTTGPRVSSRCHTHMMDYTGHIHHDDMNEVLSTIDLSHVAKNGVVFLLDGKYAAVLLANRSEIIVVSTETTERKGHIYVHGYALCISAAVNDRTLVVACKDGRILTFSIVLDLENPLEDYINGLPSRQLPMSQNMLSVSNSVRFAGRVSRASSINSVSDSMEFPNIMPPRGKTNPRKAHDFSEARPNLLRHSTSITVTHADDEAFEIKGSAIDIKAAKPVFNDKARELIITNTKIEQQKRKFPAVGRVVQLTTSKSKACCIQ